MNTIETLRNLQQQEIENGNLYNDLEDLIYGLENPQSKLESIQGDLYAGKTLKETGL